MAESPTFVEDRLGPSFPVASSCMKETPLQEEIGSVIQWPVLSFWFSRTESVQLTIGCGALIAVTFGLSGGMLRRGCCQAERDSVIWSWRRKSVTSSG